MVRLTLYLCFLLWAPALLAQHGTTLAVGTAAPDFNLKGVDGKKYNLKSFKKAKVLVVVFTCNHCPTAQAYEDRIIALSRNYRDRGVQVVAIQPNDPNAVRLDECSYTDLGDSFEDMKLRAEDKDFPFPYLNDGDTQTTATAYGAVATPHVFVLDDQRVVRYTGRFDDSEKPGTTPKHRDAEQAVEALLAGKTADLPAATKAFGCSIKWKEKEASSKAEAESWTKEEVKLEKINEEGLLKLLKNDSEKLLLINFWATWCGPCTTEFPDLMRIYHTYRVRDFDLVTVSLDRPEAFDKARKFLRKHNASGPNYLVEGLDVYRLLELVNKNWKGAIPFTLLVEPGGKQIFWLEGQIDPLAMRKKIVEHPLMGRYF